MFGSVVVPRTVATELEMPRRRFRAIRVGDHDFITITEPRDREQVTALERELDTAEAEAIVLAMELHADVLLIDEADGRRLAMSRGLATTGVLGVLVRAKTRGLIPTVTPLAQRLRSELGFHLSDAVIDEVRRLAGE